jgi:hypothetical protein
MDSNTIIKYQKYTTPKLKIKAQNVFNAYIRKRDEGMGCISCGSYNQIQAGHFYSAGNHNNLRFDIHNVNSQCKKCNYFLSGNLLEYRKNLIVKIGLEAVEKLDMLSSQRTTKNDRFKFIEIIEEFK